MMRKIFPIKKPIYIFCYHKVGTVLMGKVFSRVARVFGLKYAALRGYQGDVDPGLDIILFEHSLVSEEVLQRDFVGIHVVRDPRDILVSGYLYHLRSDEDWCESSDFSLCPEPYFPRVPYSIEHLSLECKKEYFDRLGGVSYKENLQVRDQASGLRFELDNYCSWTFKAMSEWNYDDDRILEVKFEDVMCRYDSSFNKIFSFLGFSGFYLNFLLFLSKKHDIGRMPQKKVGSMKHVSKGGFNKWQKYFDSDLSDEFKARYGKLLVMLDYEKDEAW